LVTLKKAVEGWVQGFMQRSKEKGAKKLPNLGEKRAIYNWIEFKPLFL